MTALPLSSRFVLQNALLSTRLSKQLNTRLSAHGISLSEYLLLHHLQQAPATTLPRIALAEMVGLSASGVTRLLAPMEKIGLVEKQSNPRDARQSLVKLSEVGRQLYSEAGTTLAHSSEALLERLTEKQLSQLLELYGKLL